MYPDGHTQQLETKPFVDRKVTAKVEQYKSNAKETHTFQLGKI